MARTPDCCSVKYVGGPAPEHSFARYWLVDRRGRTEKFWNPTIEVGQNGSYYVGFECLDCGEPGYAL